MFQYVPCHERAFHGRTFVFIQTIGYFRLGFFPHHYDLLFFSWACASFLTINITILTVDFLL